MGWCGRSSNRQAVRDSGRQRALLGRYARQSSVTVESREASPLSWLLRDERQSLVRKALQRISARDVDLLVLKYAEGWSARDLADRLGVSTTAIEARLHRARGRLRAELTALASEDDTDSKDADHERI